MPCNIDIYVDSSCAGCQSTRKSTSGGIAVLDSHALNKSSKAQAVIAESSGQAKLLGYFEVQQKDLD